MSKKDEIAEATIIFSIKYGFDNISIKQIQKKSGASAGSIYYHFKDKNDIIAYMVEKYIGDHTRLYKEKIKNFNGTFVERINFIFKDLTHQDTFNNILREMGVLEGYNIDYREFYLLFTGVYHQHPEIRHVYDNFGLDLFNLYKELIQEAIDKKEIRDDIDIEKIAILILTSLRGFVHVWLIPNFHFEKIMDANVELILEAVKKDKFC